MQRPQENTFLRMEEVHAPGILLAKAVISRNYAITDMARPHPNPLPIIAIAKIPFRYGRAELLPQTLCFYSEILYGNPYIN